MQVTPAPVASTVQVGEGHCNRGQVLGDPWAGVSQATHTRGPGSPSEEKDSEVKEPGPGSGPPASVPAAAVHLGRGAVVGAALDSDVLSS